MSRTVDEGTAGKVRLLTTAEVTGETLSDLPQTALYRMFCVLMVSRLTEPNLLEACRSLADIYQWQVESEKLVLSEPEVRNLGTSTPQMIERQPFQHR